MPEALALMNSVLGLSAGAGLSPRRARYFSLLRQRKVPKRKATPLSASPALRYGATCGARGRCALRNSLRADALRSNSRSESVHEARVSCGTRATPPAALLGASRGARGTKHPHGPLLRSVQLAERVALAPARRCRAQQWPEWMLAVRLFGCPTPAGCACGGAVAGWHGRRSAHASCSDSPWMSERSCNAAQ